MDCSRTWLEPLEPTDSGFVGLEIDLELGRVFARNSGRLPMEQVHCKSFRIGQSDHVAATRRICHLLDFAGCRELCCSVEDQSWTHATIFLLASSISAFGNSPL